MPPTPLAPRARCVAASSPLLAIAFVLGACPAITNPSDPTLTPLGPVALGDRIIMADPADQSLISLTVADGRLLSIKRQALSGTPSQLVALPQQQALLVLSSQDETLDFITLAEDEHRSYALGAPFEAVSVAPDGDAVIAFFPPGSARTVFHNTNAIAHVDLTKPPEADGAVVRRTLASLGGAPQAIHASPMIGGRRFAFVLSSDHVAVLELTAPWTRERSIPLVSLSSGLARTPVDVIFADRPGRFPGVDQGLWAVVTTLEGSSAFALNVLPTGGGGPLTEQTGGLAEPDFDVRLSQIAGFSGGGAVDLLTLPDGRLATVMLNPQTGVATVTQLDDGDSQSVSLEAGVDRMATYYDGDLPMAVIHRRGAEAFYILDVDAVATRKDKAYRVRHAPRPIERLVAVPDTALFLALHDDRDSGMSVIDAETDRVTSFGRTGRVKELRLRQDRDQLVLLSALEGVDYVVTIDLQNLNTLSSPAPLAADGLLVLPDAETTAVYSTGPGGAVALWPAQHTVETETYFVPGAAMGGWLERNGGDR